MADSSAERLCQSSISAGEVDFLPVQTPLAFLSHQTGETGQQVSGLQEAMLETLWPGKGVGSKENKQTKTCNTVEAFVKVIPWDTGTLKNWDLIGGL